jgi:hypothetical protein
LPEIQGLELARTWMRHGTRELPVANLWRWGSTATTRGAKMLSAELNGFAELRDGTVLTDTNFDAARREPRTPGIGKLRLARAEAAPGPNDLADDKLGIGFVEVDGDQRELSATRLIGA